VILDSSIALKWLVPEEDSESAVALLGEPDLLVPTFFHAEVANALWKKARRGEIALQEIVPHFAQLPELVTTLDEGTLMPRAFAIAAELDHPVYDCIYLALAEAKDDVLLTADRKLIAKLAGGAWAERVQELGR
jgi:predicted nucleic acid-binding protein